MNITRKIIPTRKVCLNIIRHTSVVENSAKPEDICIPKIQREFVEVRIPVKWGMIAGKWWGPQDKRPILLLHGLLECCGTYDPLMTRLSNDYSYLAIDWMGHGLSDHIPGGFGYDYAFIMSVIERIKEYFKWDKISMMGHHFGAKCAFKYGYLYPKNVDFIILLNAMYPKFLLPPQISKLLMAYSEKFLAADDLESSKTKKKHFTMDQLQEYLGFKDQSIKPEIIQYLIQRNSKPTTKTSGYYYSNVDARLFLMSHNLITVYTPERLYISCKRINFPILLIKAKDSKKFLDHGILDSAERIINMKGSLEIHSMPENDDHLHISDPRQCSPIINKFLDKHAHPDKRKGSNIKNIIVDC